MPRVIKLIDDKVETIFSERDFAYLVEKYMGYEAADIFRGLVEELETYREEEENRDKQEAR